MFGDLAHKDQVEIAIRDVGVDSVMVRYPREGHGLREPKHVIDATDRSIVIATFMALLELIRRRDVRAFQEVRFGPIYLERATPPSADAPA